MRAVDTNVVVRLLARDHPKQVAAAEAFVVSGAWVSLIVLQETMWVLQRAYGVDRARQQIAIEMLLEHDLLVLESPQVVRDALETFRASRGAGFSDCLVLAVARGTGNLPLGTFDRKLARLRGAELASGRPRP